MLDFIFYMPYPSTMNPVHAFRLTRGWSLGDFAKASNTSRVAIQRTESGVYTLVPPKIVSTILDHPTVLEDDTSLLTNEEIQDAYSNWQISTRRSAYLDQKLNWTLPPVGGSPVVVWRYSSGVASQLEFCKLLCVHPFVINKTELGLQPTLPKQLVTALIDGGWDDSFIDELKVRQRVFHEER
jgi:hypothetical protein